MKDLWGPQFWYQVVICALLILAFVMFLMPKETRMVIEARKRFKRVVKETVGCINECVTEAELKQYQQTASNLFVEYFEQVGHNRVIAGYNKMTQAIIKRTQQLRSHEKAFK